MSTNVMDAVREVVELYIGNTGKEMKAITLGSFWFDELVKETKEHAPQMFSGPIIKLMGMNVTIDYARPYMIAFGEEM